MSEDRSRARAFRERHDGAGLELAYAGQQTFLKGEPRDVEDLDDVDVAVLGAPLDAAASNRPGARYGPAAVREASTWWAYLSGYKGGLTNMNTRAQVDFSDLTVADCGDVPVFPQDQETSAESITAHVATAAERAFPVMIGGDHYCTYPAYRGFAEAIDAERVGLVQIDAHTDTAEESPIFGEHFHGSPTRLIAESDYGDYANISQIGIRGYESPGFFDFAEETGLGLYTMRDVHERGIRDIVTDAIDHAADGADAVYLTFDIDSVDPSVAPGTGTPEPAGLSSRQALTIMEILGTHDAIGAADLMEVAPDHDPTRSTQTLAAYLLVTLLERQFAE
ncbi:agmatinase family protein [Natrinema sp. SYSU A 869]|uniref:agmatinase family protein n=1 Tax=Natrinema sp. SYSU A 869 TaxID=2871694 RepID=UPI001CA39BDA|nr:agmatinase family protein [Natrinema sp. SYSU A 869]